MGLLDEIGLKHSTDKSSVKERWKDIQGYEGLYQISSFGNVKALCVRKYRGRFMNQRPEKILRLKIHRDGYLIATLCNNGINKMFQAHRLVAAAFIKNTKKKPFVNHKNGIKNDNFYLNLEWCTSSENAIHAINTGLFKPASGEASSTSKLKNNQVKEIYLSKESDAALSTKYEISRAQVWRIKNGVRWRELTKNL